MSKIVTVLSMLETAILLGSVRFQSNELIGFENSYSFRIRTVWLSLKCLSGQVSSLEKS